MIGYLQQVLKKQLGKNRLKRVFVYLIKVLYDVAISERGDVAHWTQKLIKELYFLNN